MASRRSRVLVLVAVAELLAMSLWFSATAAAPELAAEWGLTDAETAWLTIAVQLGFVAGAVLSSVFTLSDVVRPRFLFAGSAVAGAACTAAIAGFVEAGPTAIALRFLNDRLAALRRDGRSHTGEFTHIHSEYERVNSKLQHKRAQLKIGTAHQ